MKWGRSPILAGGPFLFLLLSACGSASTSPTPEQNRDLDNAELLLNAAPESLSNIDENTLKAQGNSFNPSNQ